MATWAYHCRAPVNQTSNNEGTYLPRPYGRILVEHTTTVHSHGPTVGPLWDSCTLPTTGESPHPTSPWLSSSGDGLFRGAKGKGIGWEPAGEPNPS